jgi:DNA-binding Lrp family transcriptional regulator
MDTYIISILASLNFPDSNYYKFSDRPAPYVISKRYGYSPASVYKAWQILEKTGSLGKLILLPTRRERFYYIITGVPPANVKILESNLGNLYFLEYLYRIKVYRARFWGKNMSCSDGVFVSILADSPKKGYSSTVILCNLMGASQSNILDINVIHKCDIGTNEQGKLLNYIAYSDISTINFSEASQAMNISQRSVRRRLNLLLQQQKLELLPVLDQTKIPGINTAMALIMKSPVTSNNIKEISTAIPATQIWNREIQNFYRVFFVYSTLEHLDTVAEELQANNMDYFIFIRFKIIFNIWIREGLDDKNGS